MKRHDVLRDIRRVAAELERAPSRDEYHREGKGKASEKTIKRLFGGYAAAVEAAGLVFQPDKVTDEPGFRLARMTGEMKALKSYVNELEKDQLSTRMLREMIGVADTARLGESADWLRGARDISSGITGIPTLFLSDLHFDEVVKAEQIGYVNEYDHDIAVKRIQHTFIATIDLLTKYLHKPKYEGIVCALGGDMVTGNIHEELAETNAQRINKTVMDLTDILVTGIGGLADAFGKVFVPCVVGNHGRLHRKPRAKNRVQDNFEWLIYQFAAKYFQNDDRVTFYIPDSADALYQVYGKKFCLTHGDQFHGGTGIAGIFSPLMLGMARKQRRQSAVDAPFDILMMGHWHQLLMMESLIVNGSTKGYDEYAYVMNLPFEQPRQALFVSHPEKGLTWRLPVNCDGYLPGKGSSAKRPAVSW